MLQLLGKPVIAENDKRSERAGNAPSVAAEYRVAYAAPLAYDADKERRCDAPDHPVSPVIDRPVLRKARLAQRIHPGRQADKVLDKVADRRKAGLKNIARFAAAEQDIGKQGKEAVAAYDSELCDPFHTEPDSNGIHRGDHQEDHNGQPRAGTQREHLTYRARKQRRRQRKRCGRTCKQSKNCNQVDCAPPAALNAVAQQRAAGLRELLFIAAADMYHKAESDSQNYIEAPCDRPPMEQRICGRPFLHAAHHLYLRFVRVQRPLAERVKKYIRGHGRGEYHHTPLERAVLRLFTVAKLYSAESGESDIQRAAESACAHQGIIQAEIITQKAADNAQNQL